MLLFGAETTGLPEEATRDILASGGALVKIPIVQAHVRSLNLATCVGIGLFEALRQLDGGGPGGRAVAPRDDRQLLGTAPPDGAPLAPH